VADGDAFLLGECFQACVIEKLLESTVRHILEVVLQVQEAHAIGSTKLIGCRSWKWDQGGIDLWCRGIAARVCSRRVLVVEAIGRNSRGIARTWSGVECAID
jgi:hypothetical protein